MRRVWAAAALLLLLITAALWNAGALTRLAGQLTQDLSLTEQAVQADDWDKAAQLAGQALDRWDRHGFYLHITLRHGDLQDIQLELSRLQECVELQYADQCAASVSRLAAQLNQLSRSEQLTLRNVL